MGLGVPSPKYTPSSHASRNSGSSYTSSAASEFVTPKSHVVSNNDNSLTVDPALSSIEDVYESVRSGAEGLKSADAKQRLLQDGLNELFRPPRPTLFQLFMAQMATLMIIVLLFAAFADLAVTVAGSERANALDYCTFIAIFLIIFVNAGIAAWTEYKAGDALEALAKMSSATAMVVRDGQEIQVETNTVVRGDIVLLQTGDVVPADIRLITAEDLKVSEMALTGEPDDVAKTFKVRPQSEKLTPENMVFSSCPVTNGRARGVVVSTGMNTRIGGIAKLMGGEHAADQKRGSTLHRILKCCHIPHGKMTPLQEGLNGLTNKIGILSIVVCGVVFVIGVLLKRKDPEDSSESVGLYMLLVAVTLAVAAIPEGIPLCVTISLSAGCKDMVRQNVLVRKISAVETLGCASVICSDKTGTLTEGKMNMVHAWAGSVKYDISGAGFVPEGMFTRDGDKGQDRSKDVALRSTLTAALMCCNTVLLENRDPETGRTTWTPKGNSSEAPIVVAALKAGIKEAEVAAYPRVLEVPFSSARKMMLTVVDVSGREKLGEHGLTMPAGSKFMSVIKGAPNYIVELCTELVNEHGEVVPFTAELKDAVKEAVDDYSDSALRVLAVAARPMPQLPFDTADEDLSIDAKFQSLCDQKFQLLGLVASIDRPREGVAGSVATAHEAGIRVVMITGDYLKTASAIARQIGILPAGATEGSDANAVDCATLRPKGAYLAEPDMDALTATTRVFARAKPEDKLEIVKSLQRQGFITAMTGDGVNDAPALNQADIGVAMGIQGTEVAKGASAMVLLDDNFSSIVTAVYKGRVIYAGIQKFVTFIMSVHIAAILQILICVLAGIPVMRTPLLILFLVLVTDLPPSIALGMEPGEESLLRQPPRPKGEPVALGYMWFSMTLNGLNICAVTTGLYLWALAHYCDGLVLEADIMDAFDDGLYRIQKARTVAFIALVWADNLRCYTARSFTQFVFINFWTNKMMQKAVCMAQVALYIACFVPYLSDQILGLHGIGIGWFGWAISLVGPAASLVLCELLKPFTAKQVARHQARQLKLHAPAPSAPTPEGLGARQRS